MFDQRYLREFFRDNEGVRKNCRVFGMQPMKRFEGNSTSTPAGR
jgi:hypothetical protein